MENNTSTRPVPQEHVPPFTNAIRSTGLWLLRYGLVALLLIIGGCKFFAFEAEAIPPLVSNSPFLAWLYDVLGVRGTAALFGVVEVVAAILIALRPWAPSGRFRGDGLADSPEETEIDVGANNRSEVDRGLGRIVADLKEAL